MYKLTEKLKNTSIIICWSQIRDIIIRDSIAGLQHGWFDSRIEDHLYLDGPAWLHSEGHHRSDSDPGMVFRWPLDITRTQEVMKTYQDLADLGSALTEMIGTWCDSH